MLPITKRISKYNFSSGNNIKYIVTHDVGKTSSANNNATYFGGGNRGASAHYFIDDNNIVQVVEDWNKAWHCGGEGNRGIITNSNSIGIEMCWTNGDVTDKTENNAVELVKYLMNKYNIPVDRVVRHLDCGWKVCPQKFAANNWERWWNFKKKLAGESSNSNRPNISMSNRKIAYDTNVAEDIGFTKPNGDTLSEGEEIYLDSNNERTAWIWYGKDLDKSGFILTDCLESFKPNTRAKYSTNVSANIEFTQPNGDTIKEGDLIYRESNNSRTAHVRYGKNLDKAGYILTDCLGSINSTDKPEEPEEEKPPAPDSNELYKVQVGAYKNKENAEKRLKELSEKGVDDLFIKKE